MCSLDTMSGVVKVEVKKESDATKEDAKRDMVSLRPRYSLRKRVRVSPVKAKLKAEPTCLSRQRVKTEFSTTSIIKNESIVLDYTALFENYKGPTEETIRYVYDQLTALHGQPEKPISSLSVLDSLIRTILSQNTTDITSARAFRNLKSIYPKYEDLEKAPEHEVAQAIRCCGLANARAKRIKSILRIILEERGQISLEHLRESSNEEVKKELLRFSGVGPKTVACVLMFCMHREEFPVDTHVWRISKKLRWIPESASREQAYLYLNSRVPGDIKFGLHVLLVEHGKTCARCAKNGKPRKPTLGPCPLAFR